MIRNWPSKNCQPTHNFETAQTGIVERQKAEKLINSNSSQFKTTSYTLLYTMMEDFLPLVVVVPTSPSADNSQKSSCDEYVSPLHKPHSKAFSSPEKEDVPTECTRSSSSVASASVASDIDSSCDGSIASSNSSLDDEEFSTSMEFELEVKKLKELKQRKEQTHLKHPNCSHPQMQLFGQSQNPERHSQLHPQQEKKLKHKAMQEQTERINEIHNMLSLLMDDNRESSPTSRSKYDSGTSTRGSEKKSRSRNSERHSSRHSMRHQEMRDIALRAKERMSQIENDIDELHTSFRSTGRSKRDMQLPKYQRSHRGENRSAAVADLSDNYDARRPVDDGSVSLHRITSPSFKPIPAPPLWDDETIESKRLVAPDPISERLMSDRHTSHTRSVAPQAPKRGKPITGNICDELSESFKTFEKFSDSFNFEKSPKVQKALRMSSHRRVAPVNDTLSDSFRTFEKFSDSFNFEKSPKVQKALRMSSHRRSVGLNDRFSDSFNLEKSPSARQSSRKSVGQSSRQQRSVASNQSSRHQRSILEKFSDSFNLEKSPIMKKALRLSTHRRTPKRTKPRLATITPEQRPKPSVTEGSRRSRVPAASPGAQKSLIGEELRKQIHKERPNLTGRITSILTEYENADDLRNLMNGPEEDMTERIVEVLEVLKGHGSTAAKQRTVAAV